MAHLPYPHLPPRLSPQPFPLRPPPLAQRHKSLTNKDQNKDQNKNERKKHTGKNKNKNVTSIDNTIYKQ